jgi:predicted PolB exonuclease-like 3'-5' exonuclease
MITVKKTDSTTFEVTVESGSTTTHTVTLAPDYYQKLTGGKVSEEELIKKSFEFLLEREPNTSILRSFELPVINRYFSEYEQTMQKRLK